MAEQHRKPVIDPTARAAKRGFDMLSASSVGLEMGLSVLIGILGGYWLDQHFGTTPWLMLVFLALGLVAGFRGVMRALRKADREAGPVPPAPPATTFESDETEADAEARRG